MGDLLAKLIPKFPDFAFSYWDCFLGLCFVLAPLLPRRTSSQKTSVFLPTGFGLIFPEYELEETSSGGALFAEAGTPRRWIPTLPLLRSS